MRAALAVALIVSVPAGAPSWGHGASRGLHLHAEPARAEPGARVKVSVDSSEPLVAARIGFVGEEPVVIRPRQPARHIEVFIVLPRGARSGTTVNAQAEVEVGGGKPRRASTLVEVGAPYRRDNSAVEKSTASPRSERSRTPESPNTLTW